MVGQPNPYQLNEEFNTDMSPRPGTYFEFLNTQYNRWIFKKSLKLFNVEFLKINLSNFPDFDSLKIEIELDSASDFDYDMNWERPAEHVEIEISEDELFGADREFEYGFKHNKCIKYKRKQRPDS